jgi:shikimate kinase
MTRIFIIGYMGTGKTTVGKELAKSLSLTFVDLDVHIQSQYHKTVPELFEEMGESAFRKIEQQALREVAGFENVIISTGGGAPCFFDNMEIMNQAGTTIYIETSPEVLADRLLASKSVRPLIAGKSREELIPFIAKHLADRERYYKKADIIYCANQLLSKEEIYLTVEDMVKLISPKSPEGDFGRKNKITV